MTVSTEPLSLIIPRGIGVLTLLTLVPLAVWDVAPKLFPAGAHDALAATPLALIGVACVANALARRAAALDVVKALMLAAAFFFWAANQLWPDCPLATLFNDVAIALFVVDVFLAIVDWPAAAAGTETGPVSGAT